MGKLVLQELMLMLMFFNFGMDKTVKDFNKEKGLRNMVAYLLEESSFCKLTSINSWWSFILSDFVSIFLIS
jgi:hypothetical protein